MIDVTEQACSFVSNQSETQRDERREGFYDLISFIFVSNALVDWAYQWLLLFLEFYNKYTNFVWTLVSVDLAVV